MVAELKRVLKSERWPDGSVIARPDGIPWTPWALPGSYFKLLHLNRAIGMTVALIKMDPCEKTPPHHHFGDAIVYVMEGVLTVTNTETKTSFTVKAGDFVAEMENTWHYGENKGTVPVKLFVIDEVPHGVTSNLVPRK